MAQGVFWLIHHFVCFLRYCKGLGNRADGKLGGLQQLLRGLDAAVVQVVHDGLPGHPPEQAAEVVRGKVEPRRHLGKGELLPVVGGKVGTHLLNGLVAGARCGAALGKALLLDIVQDEQQVQPAGVVLLRHGSAHHLQQGAQAANPRHRAVQHRYLAGQKQPGKIPLGGAAQLVQGAEREPTAYQFRYGCTGGREHCVPRAQQQRAAGVQQQAVFPHLQGAAALAYQQKGARLLVCRQLQLAAVQPHGVRFYLCMDLFPFRFHLAHPFRKQPSR